MIFLGFCVLFAGLSTGHPATVLVAFIMIGVGSVLAAFLNRKLDR